MDGFDSSVMFNEEGGFTDEGKLSLVKSAGEGHEETKVFDDIADVATLAKAYAGTKKAMSTKLENVIEKPSDDAGEDVRNAYKKTLLAEAGFAAPETAEGYEFKRADLPAGLAHSDDMEASFKKFFHEGGVPASIAEKTFDHFQQIQIDGHNAMIKTQTEEMVKEWPGDQMTQNNRLALRALEHFAADDDFKAGAKEAKLFDFPSDHDKWMKLGVTPAQRMMWAKIGQVAMKAESFKDETGNKETNTKTKQGEMTRAEAMRQYPATPDLWPAE